MSAEVRSVSVAPVVCIISSSLVKIEASGNVNAVACALDVPLGFPEVVLCELLSDDVDSSAKVAALGSFPRLVRAGHHL